MTPPPSEVDPASDFRNIEYWLAHQHHEAPTTNQGVVEGRREFGHLPLAAHEVGA